MILSDESKDWFENYSRAGKEAIRYNKILIDTKNNIKKRLKPNKKNINNTQEEQKEKKGEDSIEKAIEDDIDIFSLPIEPSKPKKNNCYMNQRLIYKSNYKHHDKHMQNLKKKEVRFNPTCTKYNPKYDTILKTARSLPSWEKQIGRKQFKKKDVCDKFYIEHENLIDTMAGSAFIDMSKQLTKKNSILETLDKDKDKTYLLDNYSFINNNDNDIEIKINFNINTNNKKPITSLTKEITREGLRISDKINKKFKKNNFNINKDKNFSFNNSINFTNKKIMKKILEKKEKNKDIINISNISEIKPDIDSSRIINVNDLSKDSTISIIKYNPKNNQMKSLTQNYLNNSDISSKSLDMVTRYYNYRKKQFRKKINKSDKKRALIKAPDFSKNISREDLDRINEAKKSYISYLIPNYSQVRERPKMLVKYTKKNSDEKTYRNNSAQIKGVNYSFYYDANKAIEKVNNHSSIPSFNFGLMSSRRLDDDPLPSYMKNIMNRDSLSEFSLIMNNYSNRGFSDVRTSFYPKQSFNNVINLNLLKSKKLMENTVFGNAKKKFKKSNPLLNKIIRFYKRNFETIMADKNLKKFDNITYKGIEDYKKNMVN